MVIGESVEPVRVGPVVRLVGRDRRTCARVEECWARAQAGTLATPGVVFRGEPGIGKSRLAGSRRRVGRTAEAMVVELAGSPFHTDAGLHPVRSLVGAPMRHRRRFTDS